MDRTRRPGATPQPAKIEQTHDEAVIRVGPKPSIAESVKTVPVPIPRPHELADDLAITSISGAEDRGIFERLFGSPSPPKVASAYASPEPSAAEEVLERHPKASRVRTTSRQRFMTFQGVRSTCPTAPNWRHIQGSAICWTTLST